MRNRIYKLLILGIVSFSLGLSGCKKDTVEKSKFIYELKDYIVNSGYLTKIGATTHSPATYKYNLKLIGSGITFDKTKNDFTGKGNFIGLTMYSFDSEFLTPGMYTFDGFSSKDSLTFDYGTVGINCDITSKVDSSNYIVKTGIVQVEKRGNVYILDYNIYIKDNKQVKGFYNGILEIYTTPK